MKTAKFLGMSILVLTFAACGDGGSSSSAPASAAPANNPPAPNPPGAFNLQQPANASGGVSLAPPLAWSASANATSYKVEIAVDIAFTLPVLHVANVNGNSYQVPANTLNAQTPYFWRVTASNADGNVLAANSPFSFTTTTAWWAKTYGTAAQEKAFCVRETSDGGFIVTGSKSAAGAPFLDPSNDLIVMKLNADGSVVWHETLGSPLNAEIGKSVLQFPDGSYLVMGFTRSFGSGAEDAWVLKLNPDGSIAWQKTYGGALDDWAESIVRTPDGGAIFTGQTQSFGAGGMDVWVVKLNADGTVAWQKAYGGALDDKGKSIAVTNDGGYIVVAETSSFGAGQTDVWILKLNADGSVAWQKTYGGAANDNAKAVQQTNDGGYIVSVETASFGAGANDIWILKLNADGSIAFQTTFGGASADEALSLQQTSDGSYVMAGMTSSFGAGLQDVFVMKLNANGTIAFQKTYGGAADEMATCISQTADGGFVVGATTSSFGAGDRDMWILKLDENGTLTPLGANTAMIVSDTAVAPVNTAVVPVDTAGAVVDSAVAPVVSNPTVNQQAP